MKIIKALQLTVIVSFISLISCKKESSNSTQLNVVKVELIKNGEIISTSNPVYK